MSAPLDSRQLRAFRVLARTGSFTQTARELHLTQSGISHSMKALESETGCRLLDRLGKKVVLTQAGEQLLQHANYVFVAMVIVVPQNHMVGRLPLRLFFLACVFARRRFHGRFFNGDGGGLFVGQGDSTRRGKNGIGERKLTGYYGG